MGHAQKVRSWSGPHILLVVLCSSFALYTTGCQEADTIKNELFKKFGPSILKPKKTPFTPRDGITVRPSSLYQTANWNSPVLRELPAETQVHLVDSIGEWYRVRTRDGRDGYLAQKVVGGQDIIEKTNELRRSIEGVPPQAEGVTKSRANFRLDPGRNQEIIEVLPAGKKFEVYERVVTARESNPSDKERATRGKTSDPTARLEEVSPSDDLAGDGAKKDVWYKVKIEDGRVGFLYTHNMRLSPPEDIARVVPFMRMMAWRTVNTKDDPDRGAKNNYIVAYAPLGKDAGCDYTRLYFVNWHVKMKRPMVGWQLRITGVLPITDYQFEGKPGFSVRSLHPSHKDKLVLTSFVFSQGRIKKVSEEEIPDRAPMH
ncbi:MAG: SH3 domain-containing protein [Desulfomonile tiedjei]|nr:SH3 domain-containing protein [Desulfomonile tiedjei]